MKLPFAPQPEPRPVPNEDAPMVEWALYHASLGHPVFPLHPRQKVPFPGSSGHKDAVLDEATLREWWGQHPQANVGVRCDGMVVFDDDGGGFPPSLDLPPTAIYRTGSGGTHYVYRAKPGTLASRLTVGARIFGKESPHRIDLRSNTAGYIVAPGSIHPNGGRYVIVDGRDPATLTDAHVNTLINAGAKLRLSGVKATTGRPAGGKTGDNPTLAQLRAEPPNEGGRNDWLIRVAGHHAKLIGDAYGDEGYDQYLGAVQRDADLLYDPLSADEVNTCAESAWNMHRENHPDRWGAGATGAAGAGDGKRESKVDQAINYLAKTYTFRVTTSQQVVAIPNQEPRQPQLVGYASGRTSTGGIAPRVIAGVRRETGATIDLSTVELALGIAVAEASTTETNPITTSLRFHHDPGQRRIVVDLGIPNDTTCVVVTTDGWQTATEPPTGVWFVRNGKTRPLPHPSRGGDLDALRELTGVSDEQWPLALGWLVGAPFAEYERPLLLLTGPAGSGKSERAAMFTNMWDPREGLGSRVGQIEQEQLKAEARAIASWDNLSKISQDQSDFLCRLITGEEDDKRALYTDAELHTVVYRRTGVATAIALPIHQSDLATRIVQIEVEPFHTTGTVQLSKSEIQERYDRLQPPAFGALLDLVATGLAGAAEAIVNLRAARVKPTRFMDYEAVLHAVDPTWRVAFYEHTREIQDTLGSEDPFVMEVIGWLREQTRLTRGKPFTMTTTEMYEKISEARDPNSDHWWPKSTRSFIGQLTLADEPLRSLGMRYQKVRTQYNRARLWWYEEPGSVQQDRLGAEGNPQ